MSAVSRIIAPSGPRFEVQTWTLLDGWVNTWHIEEDGLSTPETFASYAEAEAEAALEEFLAEIDEEIEIGMRERDEGYSLDEFRIAKAGTL